MDRKSDRERVYRIAVQGQPSLPSPGPVVDQSALRGILNKLWDLNLILISVTRLEKEIPPP